MYSFACNRSSAALFTLRVNETALLRLHLEAVIHLVGCHDDTHKTFVTVSGTPALLAAVTYFTCFRPTTMDNKQMNGAELPCGTTIGVQPADMDYKKKTKTEKGETNERQSVINGKHGSVESTINGIQQDRREEKTMSTAAAAAAVIHDESKDKNAKDEDDLDDFFASLE
mmetsp:Transcript_4420/g.9560  ORF Transcript_4420/g.9560 Transcript_4420/m.9560 type:complete len:170 (+) Transcript_4420:1514-2023(+)